MARMTKARLHTVLTHHVCPSLNPSAQRVLFALVGFAAPEDDGWVAFPSQEQLAKTLRMGRRTVVRAIGVLVIAGVLVRERRQGTNRYWIMIPEPGHSEPDRGVSDVPPAALRECQMAQSL